jgi:hypothetical protein
VRERVHDRRLIEAGDDERATRVRAQVVDEGLGPGAAATRSAARAGGARHAELGGDPGRERGDVGRRERQPVIGDRAGRGRVALDQPEPVHVVVGRADPAAAREVASVAQPPRGRGS